MATRIVKRKWNALTVLAFVALLSGCSRTQIPEIRGVVLDASDGHPIANAAVIATYVGNTRARDAWFLAHANFRQHRCFRTLVYTNAKGEFTSEAYEADAYFGSPYWTIKVFRNGFRSRVSGYDPESLNWMLPIWTDAEAENFDSFTGKSINYARIEHPDRLRELQRDLGTYLDDWLSNGETLRPCDLEQHSDELHHLVLDLYQSWLSRGGPNIKNGRARACDAFVGFEPDHLDDKDAQRFLVLKNRIREVCVR